MLNYIYNFVRSFKCVFDAYIRSTLAHGFHPSCLGTPLRLAALLHWVALSSFCLDFAQHLQFLCSEKWGKLLNIPEICNLLALQVSRKTKYPNKSLKAIGDPGAASLQLDWASSTV
uniref:Macaca fascicularis brain cDNA clone: QtrA-18377, similar to human solute carrier family 23 (nucleobase transporters),member 2 (SLC23A2), transcript variant 2, mRNA, RefSeq: NM_203327.1 n=1 Tax=Macaca fascicularis TaxID=9541 RepID=I7GF34_MACFA|nr:unnamed protein product [Macaca fascicularis]